MTRPTDHTDFLSLQLFLAVIDHGSIAEAARLSFIAPTAVTKRIQELESSLGVQLLVRRSKGVHPTVAGQALALHVRAITGLTQRMRTEMKDYAQGARGHVKVVANASALVESLAQEIANYMASHPDVRIDIEEAHSEDVVRAVRDGHADFGAFAPPVSAVTGVRVLPYREDRLAAAVPADHVLAGRRSVSFAELQGFTLIGAHGGSSLSNLISQSAGGLTPSWRVASNDVARWLVSKGLGVTILPAGLILPFEQALGIKAVAIGESWARRSLKLCVRDPDALSSAARDFFNALGALAQGRARPARIGKPDTRI